MRDGPPAAYDETAIEAGGRRLTLLRPADPAGLGSEPGVEQGTERPVWAQLWTSGLVLADVVGHAPISGWRVLELGCGLGAVALAAAAAGAHVTAVDRSAAALRFAQASAERNGLRVEVACADWTRVGELPAGGPWDLVVAADVLYDEAAAGGLLRVLPHAVTDGGAAWIADPGRDVAGAFVAAASVDWDVTSMPARPPVVVHRLRRAA